MNYFVTAIGTDCGKTIASAILCEALEADYWKPVQAGFPRDTETVQNLVANTVSKFHPENYLLKTPASPHAAAKIDGKEIKLSDFKIPQVNNDLIIEGAGGCLVPLNDTDFMVDLIPLFNAEVILVAAIYLGSINHTLLTIEALLRRNVIIKGIIFNGESNSESERIILHHASIPSLLRINKEGDFKKETVAKYALQLKDSWS